MNTIRYSAELERLFQKGEGIYWLSGWCFSDRGRPVTIEVTDDRKRQIPCQVRWIRRPDVETAFPDCRVADRCGFELDVPAAREIIRSCRWIAVWASDGQNRVRICRRTRRDLKLANERNRIIFYIDDISVLETRTRITGWAFSEGGECSIVLHDRNGKELPHVCRRIRRRDIERMYRMQDTGDLGFELSVENEYLPDGEVRICFGDAACRREALLDLENATQTGVPDPQITYSLLSAEKWRKAVSVLRHSGIAGACAWLRQKPAAQPVHRPEQDYADWFAAHRISAAALEKQRMDVRSLPDRPLISIAIPLYNTKTEFLRALLQSVLLQSYDRWELCLADGSTSDEPGRVVEDMCGGDPRVRYVRLQENEGIAGNTNAAIRMAGGAFVMLADHDDLLEPDALYELAMAVREDPQTDIVYTDEDLTDETGTRFVSPRFKPDFNLDFLRSINYICHIFMVRREIMEKTGGFRKEFDGAQDWDMILRCCELARKIRHIPRVLYHWRAYEESTAGNPESKTYAIEAGRRALQEHFRRCHLEAELEYTGIFILFRPVLQLKRRDLISIVIPNRDEAETLRTCVMSILEKSTYDRYEIIIVENNSEKAETFSMYETLQAASDRVRVVTFRGAFNYSAVNRFGIAAAEGEYYILLNNDTEVISPDWMERMLAHCQREDVAAVGAKLLYPDGTVQHCGAVIGLGGFAGHVLTGSQDDEAGYFGRLQAVQDVSAVTAACMMVSREAWEKTGGLDESFAVALNDMDFCLRLCALGRKIVLDPGVKLYHYESKSRGSEETPEKRERFKKEIRQFRARWKDVLDKGDPFYSPNLTLLYNDCRVRKAEERLESSEIMAEILEEDRQPEARRRKAEP